MTFVTIDDVTDARVELIRHERGESTGEELICLCPSQQKEAESKKPRAEGKKKEKIPKEKIPKEKIPFCLHISKKNITFAALFNKNVQW